MAKPIIGITCDYEWNNKRIQLYEGYYQAIYQAGGIPLLIAYNGEDDIERILDVIDGVLLTGGQDVDPSYFGQEPHPKLGDINPIRDRMEIKLCKQAMEKDMPILGICRGIQVMNVAMGGTIYQDLESQWKTGRLQKHSQQAPGWYGTHQVVIEPGSKLQKIMGADSINVNSFHHQAVCKAAPGFHISGWCQDGVIEALESQQHQFAMGVQWHPERMWEKDKGMLAPFYALVGAAKGS